MITASQLIGQPAISLADAEHTGKVKGLQFSGNRIVGVEVGKRIIPADAVRTFEGDAITYDDSGAESIEGWSGNPIGKMLLSSEGDSLGSIAELHLDSRGVVQTIVADNNQSFGGDQLLGLGSFAAVIALESMPSPSGQAQPGPDPT